MPNANQKKARPNAPSTTAEPVSPPSLPGGRGGIVSRILSSPALLIGLLLAAFVTISLLLRILPPFGNVFSGEWVKFTTLDAYYYQRLVDTLVQNFPAMPSFDPFFIFPGGHGIGGVSFFVWFQSAIISLFGLGSPSQETVNAIAVFFPPVLAALTVIPVYVIGKNLFNRWVGVFGAALIAVLPGEFIGRTMIGANDTPAAEVLFTTTALAFFIVAQKVAAERGLTFRHLLQRDFALCRRPIIYSVLAGLFLAMYLMTWQGGLLFVFILTLYFVVQFIINHLQRRSSDYLTVTGTITLLAAAVIAVPASRLGDINFALLVALCIPPVLAAISHGMSRAGWKPFWYPVALVGAAALIIVVVNFATPALFDTLWNKFSFVFFPGGNTARTTQEMQPLLAPSGTFTTAVAWGNFTTSFFLVSRSLTYFDNPFIASLIWYPGWAFITIALSVYLFIRYRRKRTHKKLIILAVAILLLATIYLWFIAPAEYKLSFPGFAFISLIVLAILYIKDHARRREWMLLFVWAVVILVAMLIQRRFAYYFVVNAAVLSAYISWRFIWLFGLRRLQEEEPAGGPLPATKNADRKLAPRRGTFTIYHVNVILAIIAVFFFVMFFNIDYSRKTTAATAYAPSDAWYESLTWLRENTPPPMGDEDAYYALYEYPAPGEEFAYPDTAYAVTSWWDYGYWISKVAQRLPNANGSQYKASNTMVAELLSSTDDELTAELLEELQTGYVVLDFDTISDKFWAILTWANKDVGEYLSPYYIEYGGETIGMYFYKPKYFETLGARLYGFSAEGSTSSRPSVIQYEVRPVDSTHTARFILDVLSMDSYEAALAYVEEHGTATHEVVGLDPLANLLPVKPVPEFAEVFASTDTMNADAFGAVSEVKVFQYLER